MLKYTVSFTLGFLASTFLFLAMLSVIEIPEYTVIYQLDRPECRRDRYI